MAVLKLGVGVRIFQIKYDDNKKHGLSKDILSTNYMHTEIGQQAQTGDGLQVGHE
jgi:hypothetical protein